MFNTVEQISITKVKQPIIQVKQTHKIYYKKNNQELQDFIEGALLTKALHSDESICSKIK